VILSVIILAWWPNNRMSDLRLWGRGFDSWLGCY